MDEIECPYCGWCGAEHELEGDRCPECEEVIVETEQEDDEGYALAA